MKESGGELDPRRARDEINRLQHQPMSKSKLKKTVTNNNSGRIARIRLTHIDLSAPHRARYPHHWKPAESGMEQFP